MTPDAEPLTSESPVSVALPVLREKWLVDAVNGIDVARARIHTQCKRSGFFARLGDGLTGKAATRQSEINARGLDSLDGSIRWLRELTESMARSNLAIVRVNEAVRRVSDDLAAVADVAVETREQLARFRKDVNKGLQKLDARLAQVDASDSANRHTDEVFYAWGAGRFHGISWAGRCYAALEELRWGDFGAFCRKYPERRAERIQVVRDRAVMQMRLDALQESADSRLPTHAWFAAPSDPLPDGVEALAYLGEDHADAPFVFALTKGPMGSPWPDAVPLVSSASRVATALADEVLGGAE